MESVKKFVFGPKRAKNLKNQETNEPKIEKKEPKQVSLASFFYPPSKTISYFAELGNVKCHVRTWDQILLLSIHSGLCIGLGAGAAYIVGYGNPGLFPNFIGIVKMLYGLIFPLGLLLLTFTGGELFTGNIMTDFFALYAGRCGIVCLGLLRNWFWSFLGNLMGTFGFVFFFMFLPMFPQETPFWVVQAGHVATVKVTKEWWSIILQGIIANWSVGLAVWSASSIHDVAGKILAMWVPIFAFAVLGYEHCIANQVTLTIGLLFGAEHVNIFTFFYNLFFATIGNIIGSGIILAGLLYYCWAFREKHQDLGILKNIRKLVKNVSGKKDSKKASSGAESTSTGPQRQNFDQNHANSEDYNTLNRATSQSETGTPSFASPEEYERRFSQLHGKANQNSPKDKEQTEKVEAGAAAMPITPRSEVQAEAVGPQPVKGPTRIARLILPTKVTIDDEDLQGGKTMKKTNANQGGETNKKTNANFPTTP